MPDHSLSKEIFPNIQSEPPLMQLEAICPRSIWIRYKKMFSEYFKLKNWKIYMRITCCWNTYLILMYLLKKMYCHLQIPTPACIKMLTPFDDSVLA